MDGYIENAAKPIAFFSVGDVAKMMGIGRATAYALAKKKGFPAVFVGNRIVIPADRFAEWVDKAASGKR